MRPGPQDRFGNLSPLAARWTSAALAMLTIGSSGGCDSRPPRTPKPAVHINNSGGFDPENALTVIDTDPYYAHFLTFAYFGRTREELVYLVLTDLPAARVKGKSSSGTTSGTLVTLRLEDGSDFEIGAGEFPTGKVQDGALVINGDSYPLADGRLVLVDLMDGPDRVQQVQIPANASDPQEALRSALAVNLAFRQFLLEQLREGLDSVELRGDAALMLYKTGLIAELPRETIQELLADDDGWVRLAAASGLWQITEDSQAIGVLARIVESDDVHPWTREIAARELRRIAPDHPAAVGGESVRNSQPAHEPTSAGDAAQKPADSGNQQRE